MRDVISLTIGSADEETESSRLEEEIVRLPRIHIQTEFIRAKQIFLLIQDVVKE